MRTRFVALLLVAVAATACDMDDLTGDAPDDPPLDDSVDPDDDANDLEGGDEADLDDLDEAEDEGGADQ